MEEGWEEAASCAAVGSFAGGSFEKGSLSLNMCAAGCWRAWESAFYETAEVVGGQGRLLLRYIWRVAAMRMSMDARACIRNSRRWTFAR